ncbi:AMP-binding protein [Mycolicibacterium fortuitum]|jgi:fatty-acyl-CoA synthase|uniref:Long-chain-fatty-acid--CoA ligase FadD13 n=1 Tax=Mycolicibacterium fortuitum TaxID=1766 RepID=A0A378V0Q9_MYCFO|nr:AMP-binding protein [Mycolicibacterium fortuitum]MCA4724062.1 AMP-binding protein [Mycolicibacterium fortuitum]OBG44441.1 acyl-CoA synthetase [Mycolicibacterium fortuitum]OBI59473.1 acyl-CoA synthetase [Mycolicibacterium fortuitum]OBK61889.1 acyl-CoA synthetase [Mycolicibacterium fortuitum]UBV21336.1 AMP-binding protein [Mycolicibacterium fortuitum]
MKRLTTTHAMSPLTPVSFLDRAAAVHGDKVAVVDGSRSFTYREVHQRCRQLAGALVDNGLQPGARVAVLSHNTREMLEGHYGVPYAAGVLVPINSRLSAGEIAYILQHSEADVVIATDALTPLAAEAISLAGRSVRTLAGSEEYEATIAAAEPVGNPLTDELSPLAINYTSGTTGKPKGVVYSHRGAYLQSLAMAFHSGMDLNSSYLWTLPMFHCNGWCFTWAVTAVGATHVCLPKVDADAIWHAVDQHEITHMCAAPTVLSSMTADARERSGDRSVWVATGGAPPAPALLARARACGLDVTHLYGMTETYGPAVINEWKREWTSLPNSDRDRLNARQGIGNIVSDVVRVLDEQGRDVPADAATVGEIALRGNNVTPEYYRDPAATAAAVPDGWFRSGDLAVRHPDGYLEIRDRAKDVIISGGENISSVEIERAILEHPAVLEAAVVAMPHAHWGERPVAFVSLRSGVDVTGNDIRDHLCDRIAKFKIPDRIEFTELPKTATGKIRKFELKKQLGQVPHSTPSGRNRP